MLKAEDEVPGTQEDETTGNVQELEEWKRKVEKAEKEKADLLLSKLAAQEERRKWEEEVKNLRRIQDKLAKERMLAQENYQRDLNEQSDKLRREIQFLKDKLAAKKAIRRELTQIYKLKRFISETKVTFTRLEKVDNEEMCNNICCFFDVSTNVPFILNKGEALITFEEENVAQELLQRSPHAVKLENGTTVVRARPVELGIGTTFQLCVKISQRKIKVSNIPDLPIPDEWVRDKLELNFCKTKLGGGEVQNVTYDRQSQMALITFMQPGVANNIVKWAEYPFHTSEQTYLVTVSSVVEKYLERFEATAQAAKPERTIIVYGIPDGLIEDEVMADILMIHFQKAKYKGGGVKGIVYPTPVKGVAHITFEDKQVAENVVAKAEHCLQDKRLPMDYPLKVSLYTESVFTSVSCLLDLSVLREKSTLEDLVKDLEKNLPVLNFGTLHPDGQITVQGPFSAIRALQKKLELKLLKSVSKAEVKPGRKESTTDSRSNTRLVETDLSLQVSNNFVQSTKNEKLTVALDSDIYLYIKKFKEKLYQENLKTCRVISHEFRDGEVTTICFDTDPASPSAGQLELAKNIVEDLAASLQSCLRKERLSLERFSRAEKHQHQQACEKVSSQYPRVLVLPYSTHIDIIGTSSDIYEFTQQVNKMTRPFREELWR